jgi:hypothetical protein
MIDSRVFAAIGGLVLALAIGGAKAARPAQQADAAQQAPSLPPAVAAWLDQARQDCPAGFQAKDEVEEADLTGTGRPGYIANPHGLTCAGEPHLYGGDGPASIELFVTTPSGEVVHVAGVLALGYQIEPSTDGGPPIIAFQTHEDGDPSGSVDNYRWDGRAFQLLSRNSMAVPPVDGADPEDQQ